MKRLRVLFPQWLALLIATTVLRGPVPRAWAELVTLAPVRDNTLFEFQFDPNNPDKPINSNGIGNFFAAGCTFSRGQIQRGLIEFDLSEVPVGAVVLPGSVSLQLYVVDAPKKDSTPREFWLVPVPALDQAWGEGESEANQPLSGAGRGAPAELGDATWFHTQYDPELHGDNPDDDGKPGSLEPFDPNAPGFWQQEGLLGGDALNPWTAYGEPAGIAGGVHTDVYLTSQNMPSMAADIQAWLDNPASNFGWVLLGDETVNDPDLSSKRGFASLQHEMVDWRPLLTFQYIPEPGSALLLALALAGLALRRRDQSVVRRRGGRGGS